MENSDLSGVLSNFDFFVTGFADFCDDFFFFDAIDYASFPDALVLYDTLGGSIFTLIHLDFLFEDALDDELEDEENIEQVLKDEYEHVYPLLPDFSEI